MKVVTVQQYLDCMLLLPKKPTTLIGIGYNLYGSKAVYLISVMIILNAIGLTMCYLIVLGSTLASWA